MGAYNTSQYAVKQWQAGKHGKQPQGHQPRNLQDVTIH